MRRIIPESVDIEAVKRRLEFDYLEIRNDPSSRTLWILSTLLSKSQRPQIAIHDLPFRY